MCANEKRRVSVLFEDHQHASMESKMRRILIVAALIATSSVAKAQAVNVTLSEWKVELSRDTVKAGPVTFKLKNAGSMNHAFYVRGEGFAKGSKEVATGQEAPLTLTLKPGTYDVYCPLADLSHKMAGMSKKFVVVP
jgi:uncharacterized cupredoxin-like copper-binding protein